MVFSRQELSSVSGMTFFMPCDYLERASCSCAGVLFCLNCGSVFAESVFICGAAQGVESVECPAIGGVLVATKGLASSALHRACHLNCRSRPIKLQESTKRKAVRH